MWLRKINDSGKEFRYELETFWSAPLLLEDFTQTQVFPLSKYFKNNEGKFQLCKSNERVYVKIETLMNNFVVIDSPVDKTISELSEFKKNVQAKSLEDSLKPFIFSSVEECDSLDSVEQLEPQPEGVY